MYYILQLNITIYTLLKLTLLLMITDPGVIKSALCHSDAFQVRITFNEMNCRDPMIMGAWSMAVYFLTTTIYIHN